MNDNITPVERVAALLQEVWRVEPEDARGVAARMLEISGHAVVQSANAAIFDHPAYPVIAGGQLRLMEAGIGGQLAWDISRSCLIEHMADEKIKLGDKRYAWDAGSGRHIVEEYYLDHAESSQ